MISCSVEDPDGGGGGGGGLGMYNGTGEGVMSSGSLWTNMPSSADITVMTLYKIIYDQAPVQGDLIDFSKPNKISSILARSGTTSEASTYTGTPITFNLM